MDKTLLYDRGLFAIRAALAVIFIFHGLQKLTGAFGGSGIQGFSEMLTGMGFGMPYLWAWFVALIETLGGVCLLLGLCPRISAALIGIIMLVAIAQVHGKKGFFFMNGGFEYQFLILANCAAILCMVGGKYSFYDKC